MKTIFEKGDKVFDIRFGWGVVIFMYSFDWEKEEDSKLVCDVKFKNGEEVHYSKGVASKLLSFTEYALKGLNQVYKEDYSKYIDKWCKFKDKDDEEYFYLCKLKRLDERGLFFDSKDIAWDICEPLTEEQVRILNLE
jgi:hypothetical protein|nr:MAG TPA: hypothetical protein [Caudoviricetes sp.]